MRTNAYDEPTGTVTVSADRAAAVAATAARYDALFGGDPALHALRQA
jgi:nitric oxide reductase subunit B